MQIHGLYIHKDSDIIGYEQTGVRSSVCTCFLCSQQSADQLLVQAV